MRNPLTQFTGPEFLVFFAILIIVVAVFCWRRKRTQDNSLELPPLDASARIDPYDIAYLRGGQNELARVLIVGLIERKYLQITAPKSKLWKTKSDSQIQQDPAHPDISDLSPIERAAFEWFDSPKTADEVFTTSSSTTNLPSSLVAHAVKYEQKLRAGRLLVSDEAKTEARKNIAFGIAFVLLVGVTRLLIGISRHRPVGFLVLMGIAGIVVIVRSGLPGRLSLRGQQYLERTRNQWNWLKDSHYGDDWSPSLAAGVFGYTALAGTEMSPLNDMFRRANAGNYYGTADGGGGGGGGGDGGGGGSCSGGCGGCGG